MQLPEDPWTQLWWLRGVVYTLFAGFGGLMGYLMRTVDKKETINWARAMLEGSAAGFVGYIILLLCSAIKLGEQWTGVIVGVSGWLGANVSIRMLEGMVRKKLGVDQQKPEDPPHDDPAK
jgi:hypothetical protein